MRGDRQGRVHAVRLPLCETLAQADHGGDRQLRGCLGGVCGGAIKGTRKLGEGIMTVLAALIVW